jgi:regulator of sigma E protease
MFLFLAILAFIFILSFLFITHEFGHFIASKKVGVPVLEFGLGLPPALFKWKKGGTVYSINLIPFGAFVRILGQDEPKNKNPKSYWKQSVGKRFLIGSGGILANFLSAWLILTISLWIYAILPAKNFIVIQEVVKGSPAYLAELKAGDLIISANGQVFSKSEEVSQFTKSHQNQEITLVLRRFGKEVEKTIKLGSGEAPLGISMVDAAGSEKIPFWKAPIASAEILGTGIYLTASYLGKLIARPFIAEKVSFELGGPVAMWGFVSQFTAMGFLYLFRLAAMLSLGLGFFNLLPLPALDGGRLVFLTLEKMFGRKVVKPETENIIHSIGFVLLIGLSVLIAYKDVLRLLSR